MGQIFVHIDNRWPCPSLAVASPVAKNLQSHNHRYLILTMSVQSPPPSSPISFSTHLGPDPSFWAPFTPLTSTPQSKPAQPSSVDEIYKQHNIPFNLCALEEIDRLTIAYAFEERAIMVDQLNIVERRRRQQLVLARTIELDAETAYTQLLDMNQTIDEAMVTALRSVAHALPAVEQDTDPLTHRSWTAPRLPGKFFFKLSHPGLIYICFILRWMA